MKNNVLLHRMKYYILLVSICITSCIDQDGTNVQEEITIAKNVNSQKKQTTPQLVEYPTIQLTAPPISDFVRRIFQDSNGNLWLGTNGDGVARYNGKFLEYFTFKEGFGGAAVRSILEDRDKNIWFGTNGGVTKYDGTTFTNYTEKEGLADNNVWSMTIDKDGMLWIGTLQGINTFDGASFKSFLLPETEEDHRRGVTSKKIVHSIMQDSKNRMWFGTNGGAYIYDGKTLTNLSEKDGLSDNSVNDILEDTQGNFWLATHFKGISKYDGTTFTNYTKDGVIAGDEVWSLYEDQNGHIWFPAEHYGVYRYDGTTFTNFYKDQGLTTNGVQSVFQDRQGKIWAGGWQGLFRKEKNTFVSVSINGPWK
ncbi:ligand-binding sensor domain-containing protein [Dokdonia pacifica]|nr:two-component regulator propeller domain-containing protein [Dokdonia pacifica]